MSTYCWWCCLKRMRYNTRVWGWKERAIGNETEREREKTAINRVRDRNILKKEKQRDSEKASGLKLRSTSRSCQNIQSFLAAEVWLCLRTFCFESSNFLTLIILLPASVKEKAEEKAQQVTVVHSSHDLIMRGLWVGFSRAVLRWITTLLLQLPSENS